MSSPTVSRALSPTSSNGRVSSPNRRQQVGAAAAARTQSKKYAWSFPKTKPKPPDPSVLPPASTKYSPSLECTKPLPKAYSIGTRPTERSKAKTPGPGDYELANPNYTGKVFISKFKAKSVFATSKPIVEREMEGPAEFLRAKGGKISSLPRFQTQKTTDESVGPGTYTGATLPARRTPGPSFGKGSSGPRGPRIARAVRSLPGPGTYDLRDRTLGNPPEMITFAGAVYISRHIALDDDVGDMGNFDGGNRRFSMNSQRAMANDAKFIQSTNQDIQRYKMMSALRN